MNIKSLFPNLKINCLPQAEDVDIKGIACNSKFVAAGWLFAAIKGTHEDGNKYIDEAISKGANVILKEGKENYCKCDNGIIYIHAKDTRRMLSRIAASFYARPADKIKVIGITGTNGKTTVSYLLEKILTEAGFSSGVIGTVSYKYKDKILPATNTTPDPLRLQSFLADMVSNKIDYCVMEVTSHALDQDRVADINFSSAIFTNLTHDHLDYHLTINKYFQAKQKLFKNLGKNSWAIVNNDDPFAGRLLKNTPARTLTYAINKDADVRAEEIKLDLNQSSLRVDTPKGKIEVNTVLLGYHNVYNILAAIGLGVVENIALGTIKRGIEKLKVVPGRLEYIDCGQPFKVFVDYAHTDDALNNVLLTLRKLNPDRIIAVFGCGGDRDKKKRPKMGKLACQLADFVILTSDNPRSEGAKDIVKDILKGITTKNYKVILDRKEAIQTALGIAKERDSVLIAGKGHEAYQIYKDRVMPFDDRQIARDILKCSTLKKY